MSRFPFHLGQVKRTQPGPAGTGLGPDGGRVLEGPKCRKTIGFFQGFRAFSEFTFGGHSGRVLGGILVGFLGFFWGHLAAFLGTREAAWGDLGATWGPFWSVSGLQSGVLGLVRAAWWCLGPSWYRFGLKVSAVGLLGAVLGQFWGRFGASVFLGLFWHV